MPTEKSDVRLSKDPENSLNGFINELLDDINEYTMEKQEKDSYHPALSNLSEEEARRENFTASVQDSLEELINYFDHRIESDQAFENPHLEKLVVNCAKAQHIDLTDVSTLNHIIKLLMAKLPTAG